MALPLLVGDVFANAARAVPDRMAAALGDDAVTFGRLDAVANRTARALAEMGVGPGTRVCVQTGTTLDVLPVFVALAKLGAVYAPIVTTFTADEATPVVTLAEPALLIADAGRAAVAADAASRTGVRLVLLPELAALGATRPGDALPRPAIAETDPHAIFFTSGSTGRQKGVVLSHRANMLRTHPGGQLEPRGTNVCAFPLFHMAGWTISLQQWQARGAVVYVDRADGAPIVEAIERHRAERFYGVPAVWQRVFDHLGASQLPTLRFADTGTSSTPPELLSAIRRACPNAQTRVFYGSTEAGNVASLDDSDAESHPGSCGLPSSFADVRVADDGELCVRGPALFDGYFRDDAATAASLDGEWFRTGDVASADADGYLAIVGRVGEVIRTGGEAVGPAEVEAVLVGVAGIREVAVVGIPDTTWGEVVCAVVVPSASAAPSLEALRTACAGRLAPHKHPRRIHVVDALPRTAATGQIQRHALVEQIQRGGS